VRLTLEPSAWEWAFPAGPLSRTDPSRARKLLRDGLEQHPEAAMLHYNVACLNAVEGRRDEALEALAEAIRRRPKLAEWARKDDDLERLRDDPRFRELVGPDG
jgi:predicted Zn-dependent protease